MAINKTSNRIKALKIFMMFTVVLILMNLTMAYMVSKYSSSKELNKLRQEIEGLKYELNLAKEENVNLTERIKELNEYQDKFKKIIEADKKKEKKTINNSKKKTNKKSSNKTINKSKKKSNKTVKKIENKSNDDIIMDKIRFNYYDKFNFKPLGYKDVEYDIINGKIKIPNVREYKEETIENKIEEVLLNSDKYKKYDVIISKAKSYGRDVSYLDYKFLDYVFDEARESNVNPYVILGIIAGESNFYAAAKNKNSSATGLGQIIKGTGSYIHYNVLGYTNEYNHNIQKDPKTNIKYMIGYFKYLKKHNSYDKAMCEYCGSKSYYVNTYRNKLVNNMVALGLTKTEANSILKGQIV